MFNYFWFKIMDLGMFLYGLLSTQDVMTITIEAVAVALVVVLAFAVMQRVDDRV